MAGRLDPHVRSPDLVERHADEVAGDVAGAERDDARRAVPGQKRGDLGPGGVRLLVARVERGLGTTTGRVPGGEQHGSAVEVLLGECSKLVEPVRRGGASTHRRRRPRPERCDREAGAANKPWVTLGR